MAIPSVVFQPSFAVAQSDPQLQAPDTIEEAKEGFLNIGDKIFGAIPRVVARIWSNEVIPAWRAMGEWAKTEIWQKRVLPAFQSVSDRGKELLGQEAEKRKPIIEQELEKEKREFQQELEQHAESAGKTLWQRFLDLFREE